MPRWRIPLSDLDYGPREQSAVRRVLRSRWLTMGPEVEAFEKAFAEFIGVKHAIAVANATAGLHLAYLALGLEAGDEIIQPAVNFVAAANMTAAVGARPVFGDIIGLAEPTLDPAEIERRLTARTRAVVVMHYGGHLCRMAEISALCRRHRLALIEDACHAVGASDPRSRRAGSLGDIGCFSFFGNKNLATGEGGMVTTDRDELAERIRLRRSHGMTTLTWDRHRGHASSYDVSLHGYNYRLDELHAALGRVQLEKLPRNNRRRARLAAIYRRRLAEMPDWVVPFSDDGGDSAHHLMVAVAPSEAARQRAAETLRAGGIQSSLHYPCIPDFQAFARHRKGPLERSRVFARRALTLPLFPTMTPAQVAAVCDALRTASP